MGCTGRTCRSRHSYADVVHDYSDSVLLEISDDAADKDPELYELFFEN